MIYLSVSTNKPGIKSEISGIMWQVAPESKIQLVSCDMSPWFLLGFSVLEDICVIFTYIFYDSLSSVLFSDVLYIFVNMHTQFLGFYMFKWIFLSEVSSFGNYSMKRSSDPHLKHIFGLLTVTFIALIIIVAYIRGWFIIDFFISLFLKEVLNWVWTFAVTSPWFSNIGSLIISYWIVQIQIIFVLIVNLHIWNYYGPSHAYVR